MPTHQRFFDRRALLTAAALVLAPVVAVASPGHGGDGDPTAAEADRTIAVEAAEMRFVPGSIKVRPGETVRFIVTNTDAVEHEFAVDTPAHHRDHRDAMREKMQQGATMAELMHDDPTVVSLAPGETRELVLTIEDPAAVEMACNLPGHYASGMRGDIDPVGGASGS